MLRPKHPCAHAGCRETTSSRYCEKHREKRPSARTAGYDARWDRYSKGFLRNNAFCCDPFGRHRGEIIPAAVTGHKTAHKGNEAMLWDASNHYAGSTFRTYMEVVNSTGGNRKLVDNFTKE